MRCVFRLNSIPSCWKLGGSQRLFIPPSHYTKEDTSIPPSNYNNNTIPAPSVHHNHTHKHGEGEQPLRARVFTTHRGLLRHRLFDRARRGDSIAIYPTTPLILSTRLHTHHSHSRSQNPCVPHFPFFTIFISPITQPSTRLIHTSLPPHPVSIRNNNNGGRKDRSTRLSTAFHGCCSLSFN